MLQHLHASYPFGSEQESHSYKNKQKLDLSSDSNIMFSVFEKQLKNKKVKLWSVSSNWLKTPRVPI
jgi:hypothetical protein